MEYAGGVELVGAAGTVSTILCSNHSLGRARLAVSELKRVRMQSCTFNSAYFCDLSVLGCDCACRSFFGITDWRMEPELTTGKRYAVRCYMVSTDFIHAYVVCKNAH